MNYISLSAEFTDSYLSHKKCLTQSVELRKARYHMSLRIINTPLLSVSRITFENPHLVNAIDVQLC